MTDADQFEQKWEEVNKEKINNSNNKYQFPKTSPITNINQQIVSKVAKVNWRWSRVLGYHVPDAHDAL